MANIILFGLGTTAEVVHYHLTRESHHVAAFAVDAAYLKQTSLLGCPVVDFAKVAQVYPPDKYQMMIAVGYGKVNQLRAQRCAEAKAMGYTLFSYVSPTAVLWDGLELKENTRIGAHALIQPYSQIGENVFIGSKCIIGHHSIIKDHCFLAAQVTLGGSVVIEPYSFLGTGSIVRNKVHIAARSVVGVGAVILKDTREGGVYVAPGAEELNITSDVLSPG